MHVPRRVRVLISFLISATTITVATPAAAVTCPVYGSPKDAGTISISGLNEVSGVVASRQYPVLWIHEDSGNPAVIYAIAPDGHKKAAVAIHHAPRTESSSRRPSSLGRTFSSSMSQSNWSDIAPS